jgi:hypothetical protein
MWRNMFRNADQLLHKRIADARAEHIVPSHEACDAFVPNMWLETNKCSAERWLLDARRSSVVSRQRYQLRCRQAELIFQ